MKGGFLGFLERERERDINFFYFLLFDGIFILF